MPKTLFHYTKVDKLSSIIREDGLHFWATRYNNLDDKREYAWPLLMAKSKFKDMYKDARSIEDAELQYKQNGYVLSFSTKGDDAKLWKSFCPGGGIMLEIDADYLWKEVNKKNKESSIEGDILVPIFYANENNLHEKFEEAVNVYERLYATDMESYDLLQSCFMIKHEDHNFESECRYIRFNKNTVYIDMDCKGERTDRRSVEASKDVKYRLEDGKQIPYVDILFSPKALKSITIDGANVLEIKRTLSNEYDGVYSSIPVLPSNAQSNNKDE